MKRRHLPLLATVFSTLLAAPALAENFALLVGASTYQNLDERYWLRGPANDVALVRDYLIETAPEPFQADNITVLADGVEGADGAPTLAGIRAGFAALATKVGPDDFIYLHFSGHGTQAPALDPENEIDGLDELFLPVDIGPWNDSVGSVENALVDDEIGTLIDSLRANGATVWAVFDACHSGTVTRAAPSGAEEVRLRKLAPDALGVPDAAMEDAKSQSRALPDARARPPSPMERAPKSETKPGSGAFIAFYAAQTTETTPEKRLPRGAPDRKSLGVFTYTIFETLAQNPGLTYRQLGQEVLRKYAVQNLALSTPMFEGDLDGYVFSGEATERIVQWPVETGEFGLTLRAGQLQNLGEGDVLALLPTAATSLEGALGYVRVTYADTFSAELEPVEHAGLSAPDPSDIPNGAFARQLTNEMDFTLRVALPQDEVPLPGALNAALDLLAQDIGNRVQFVAPADEADIRLAVIPDSPRPDAIWMLPGTGYFEPSKAGQTPSIGTQGRNAAEIAALMQDNLERMGRAINLLRMGGQYDNVALGVELQLLTKTSKQRELRALDLSAVPVMLPDDQMHVLARNNEDFPIDANVLHIGSDYSITHFYQGRLQPGDTLRKGLFRITDKAFGRDRVVVILTPATPQSPVEDLRFLAQDAIEVTRGNAPGGSGFAASLRMAGFGTVTRGAVALEDDNGPAPVILQFDIDTAPAQ